LPAWTSPARESGRGCSSSRRNGSRFCAGSGKDPENPAFTILEKRQTFLEDAPLDQVLRYAVTHELAHAMCREVDEAKATTLASQLLVTGTVACGV